MGNKSKTSVDGVHDVKVVEMRTRRSNVYDVMLRLQPY